MTPVFDVVSIAVRDLGASLAFYRRLGLPVPPAADDEPHVEVSLPNGMRICWDTESAIRSFHPSWTPPSGSSRTNLAFRCADAAEVDRVYADLVDAGHDGYLAPWDAFWGQRYASVHDPDGNGVDLYAPLPGQG